jgi:hypothetical protein
MARIRVILGVLTCAAGVVAVLTAIAGNVSAHGTPAIGGLAASESAAANLTAARADAAVLLGEVSLPAGATPSASEPAGDDGRLASSDTGPATPNLVDDHAWWVLPGAPAQALTYIRAHPPAGSTLTGTDSGSTRGVITSESLTFGWPPITGVLDTRQLSITAVALPGAITGLRADAQVVWVTPRPASETIPTSARLLRVSVHSSIPANLPHQRPLRFTSLSKIEGVVALLNSLPAAQPGTRSCPDDPGIRVRLAFYAKGVASPLAVARIDPYGCGGVQLTIGGRAQPPLESEALPGTSTTPQPSLILRIDRVLGVKLKISPRHPRVPNTY